MHGRGELKYSAGDSYRGSFKENLFDGFGVFTQRNGTQYEGWWHEGLRCGQGRHTIPAGELSFLVFLSWAFAS